MKSNEAVVVGCCGVSVARLSFSFPPPFLIDGGGSLSYKFLDVAPPPSSSPLPLCPRPSSLIPNRRHLEGPVKKKQQPTNRWYRTSTTLKLELVGLFLRNFPSPSLVVLPRRRAFFPLLFFLSFFLLNRCVYLFSGCFFFSCAIIIK